MRLAQSTLDSASLLFNLFTSKVMEVFLLIFTLCPCSTWRACLAERPVKLNQIIRRTHTLLCILNTWAALHSIYAVGSVLIHMYARSHTLWGPKLAKILHVVRKLTYTVYYIYNQSSCKFSMEPSIHTNSLNIPWCAMSINVTLAAEREQCLQSLFTSTNIFPWHVAIVWWSVTFHRVNSKNISMFKPSPNLVIHTLTNPREH